MVDRETVDKAIAWVVGVGASRGLGAAAARRFAREGFAVTVTERSPEALAIIARSALPEAVRSRRSATCRTKPRLSRSWTACPRVPAQVLRGNYATAHLVSAP